MKIQYAGWTDAATQQLNQKQVAQLAKQLKAYVNSTKFVQEGSKINKVNDQGVLTKVPVKDVTYYTDAEGSNPMSAQDLDDFIRTAIINKDPEMLRQASLYRFYNSIPIKTSKQLAKQRVQDHKKRLSRNALISSSILGVGGLALPIAGRLVQGKDVDSNTMRQAILLALAGIGTGFIAANLTTKV